MEWLEELRAKVSGSNPSTTAYHKIKRGAGAELEGFPRLKKMDIFGLFFGIFENLNHRRPVANRL